MDDYYPFGMEAMTYTRTAADPTKYLYNGGVEKNDLTSYYETFYRQYDASIGRFTGVDIYAGAYSSLTPYQYAANDPVYYNDPMGDVPQHLLDEVSSRGRSSLIEEIHRRNENMCFICDGGGGVFGGGLGFTNGMSYGGTRNYDGTRSDQIRMQNALEAAGLNLATSVVGAMSYLLGTQYGGYWNSSTPNHVGVFGSENTALSFGVNYNNLHNSWGNTWAGSEQGAYDNMYTERMLAQNVTIDARYAMASLDPGDKPSLWSRFTSAWGSFYDGLGGIFGNPNLKPDRMGPTFLQDDRDLQERLEKNKSFIKTPSPNVVGPPVRDDFFWDDGPAETSNVNYSIGSGHPVYHPYDTIVNPVSGDSTIRLRTKSFFGQWGGWTSKTPSQLRESNSTKSYKSGN